jgi:hypothetical protein
MAVRTKRDAIRVLADVTGDKRFFCQDGFICKNLAELSECLSHMSEEVYNYHTSDNNNDFSNWIRDVLDDKTLAGTLLGIKKPAEADKVVSVRIDWLRKKLNQVN